MHSSGSILKTYCEKVRHYLDDPDLDAKYDDNYLVRFFLPSAMTDVISRVSQMSDAQIVSSFEITVQPGTDHYKLPPAVAQVLRIGTVEPVTGLFLEDMKPRNQFNINGPGWAIVGNTIKFLPAVETQKTMTVVFVPSGDVMCHYVSTATAQFLSQTEFIMPTTVTLGTHDKRPHAYLGCYARIFGANVTDELLVTEHDVASRVLSFSTAPINSIGISSVYSYEVVPFLMEPMIDAISISAAIRAGVGRKINQTHMQSLMLAYKQAIKTAHDTLANMNGRVGKYFAGNTIDSNYFYVGATGSSGGTGGSSGGCENCASESTLQQALIDLDYIAAELYSGGADGSVWV
jgi:hypothetical protein